MVSIPVLALLIVLTVFYLFQQQDKQAQGWVVHSFEARSNIREALLELANAETGLRGYLLTRRDSDLATYRSARTRLPKLVQALQNLVADNPSETARAMKVQVLLGQVEQSMESLQRQAAQEPGGNASQIELDRANLRALRGELAAMENEEDALLHNRNATKEQAQNRLEVTIFAGGVLGLLGGLIGALLFTTSIANRVTQVESDAHKVAEGIPVTCTRSPGPTKLPTWRPL